MQIYGYGYSIKLLVQQFQDNSVHNNGYFAN